MKRVTQILASILFIITVLTVYLAFDFAVNTAVSNNYSTDKHIHPEQPMKVQVASSDLLLLKAKKINQTVKSDNDNEHNHIIDQERRTRSIKKQQDHVKPAQFHKSKTGVKIDHIKKSLKQKRQRLSRKDIKSKIDV